MAAAHPSVVLRLGSHSEKEYFQKMARFFDGVIIGANLLEATPGATASLSLQLGRAGVKVYVDPVTHSFGLPLDSLRSVTSSEKKSKKRKTEGIKRSYRQLADRYGPPFVDCL